MKEEIKFSLKGNEWGKLQDEAFLKVNKKAKIDGFRPGKAPRSIYEKKYGTQEILFEAADIAIKKEYDKILSDKKLLPVIEPKIDLVKCNDDELEVTFIFVLEPKVELGKYTNLGIKKDKVKVTKEEVEHRIEHLLEDYAELEVKEGKVEEGDITIIDFKGMKDGVAFDGGTAENYSLTIGSHSFIPGFEEGMIGMEKGETRNIDLTFPEDYMSEELKGQKVVFEVKVNEIKKRVIPELTTEFFEDLAMEGVTSKKELEATIKAEITEQKEHEIEHLYEDKCLEKAASSMKIDVCEELINDEIEHMYEDFIRRMQMQGISEEMYYTYTKSSKEDVTKQMKDEAVKRINYRYLLKAVIDKEKIKVTDKEAKERANELAKMYNVSDEEILKEISLENLKFETLYKKAMDIVCFNEEKETK